MVDDWARDRESTLAGTLSRSKNMKVDKPSGEVAVAVADSKVYPHNAAASINPRDETPAKVSDNNKRKFPTKEERVANYVCEHCQVAGHYGINCRHLSTTGAMRAESSHHGHENCGYGEKLSGLD